MYKKIGDFMDTKISKLNYYTIIFIVLLLPIYFVNYLIKSYFSYTIISFNFEEILWCLIPLLLFMYVYNLCKKRIKLNILDYLIFIIIFLNFIVCNFAIDMTTSIWGSYFRGEGLLSFISYYLIFLNCRTLNDTKKINNILNVFISVGVLQSIYCFIQIYFKDLLLPGLTENLSDNMATGFINNANFMGSYVVLLLGITTTNFLIQEKKYKKYFILSIIFYINLILGQSTGPFLGFIFMLMFLIIFLIIKNKLLIKRLLILILCLILTYFAIDYTMRQSISYEDITKEYTINYDLKQLFRAITGKMKLPSNNAESNTLVSDESNFITNETTNENNSNDIISDEDNLIYLGSSRILIWQNSFKLVPKYFWFGCGIDNFGYAYKWHYENIYYDKAHNDYLQILVTQGIFVLITYIIFLITLIKKGIKSNNTLALTLPLVFSVIGYCIQSFTNISVVNVAPYFYMICGLLTSTIIEKTDN